WLKKEARSQGDTWMLFFRTTRKLDRKRIENKIPIGLVKDFPDKNSAWAEVERLHLQINPVDSRRGVTFGDLALHYAEHELVERTESIHPKAHTTIKGYERVLRNRLLPRWGNRIALGIEPLEVEQWLKALKIEEELANPTLDRMRRSLTKPMGTLFSTRLPSDFRIARKNNTQVSPWLRASFFNQPL